MEDLPCRILPLCLIKLLKHTAWKSITDTQESSSAMSGGKGFAHCGSGLSYRRSQILCFGNILQRKRPRNGDLVETILHVFCVT
ncbi:hypothetical protein PSHT_10308, partial [Puccinia striiformis]